MRFAIIGSPRISIYYALIRTSSGRFVARSFEVLAIHNIDHIHPDSLHRRGIGWPISHS